MKKKIKIKLQACHSGDFQIIEMTNAVTVYFRIGNLNTAYSVGSVVPASSADRFARDNQWEVCIFAIRD